MTYGGQYDGGFQWDVAGPIDGYGEQYDGGFSWDTEAEGNLWVVAGARLPVTAVRLTPTTLTLTVRVREASVRAALDDLDSNAGSLDERERADGTNEAVDTAGGQNTYTVAPPLRLRPPRITREWVVDDVTRRRASADTKAIRGTVTFVARETRAVAGGLADPSASGAWEFAFADGTVVTPRVSDISQGATTRLQILLSPRQAELAESVTAATAGAVVNPVPDGETFTRDTTPDSRQTVDITPPSGATDPAIPAGEYVIEEWTSRGSDGGAIRWQVSLSSRYEPQ